MCSVVWSFCHVCSLVFCNRHSKCIWHEAHRRHSITHYTPWTIETWLFCLPRVCKCVWARTSKLAHTATLFSDMRFIRIEFVIRFKFTAKQWYTTIRLIHRCIHLAALRRAIFQFSIRYIVICNNSSRNLLIPMNKITAFFWNVYYMSLWVSVALWSYIISALFSNTIVELSAAFRIR